MNRTVHEIAVRSSRTTYVMFNDALDTEEGASDDMHSSASMIVKKNFGK